MSRIPADYPPPVKANEFVGAPAAGPELQLNAGVLFVGAGPASLAGAIRLSQLLETEPELKAGLGDFPVVVVEKGKFPGAHLLSGAIINPVAFHALFPEMKDEDFPFFEKVSSEKVYFLTKSGKIRIPTPPTMKNHGNFSASLSKVGAWLAEKAGELGVTVLPETAGTKLLLKDNAVVGIKTDDKGRNQDGSQMPNFQEGSEFIAKVTVLGEGNKGHLTQAALEHFSLHGEMPQIAALGVKEIWKVKKPLKDVVHTMGWPLKLSAKHHEFGGSFVYPYGKNKVALGLVVGLDSKSSGVSVHDLLQEMKLHPFFADLLKDGERLSWGAKTIPEGGYYALPSQLHFPGGMFIGDSAGFVNVPALKGIHYAMWSGMLAAETIFEQLKAKKNLQEAGVLASYHENIHQSFIIKDLYKVRNMRQAFGEGFWKGSVLAGLMTVTGGAFPGGKRLCKQDSQQELFAEKRNYPKPDHKLTFSKLDSVMASGNRSKDKQPNHLRVAQAVSEEVGNAIINMCPAEVYEWKEHDGKKHLFINPTNCIHCNAISFKGGRLTPPEGGSGPEYEEM
ncbi:MAG: electron transfer flavoprotein [Deltaproteobacteria bacterium CG_4_10_14_0_2_um_filter_43_8]|nr:MAG: electron transfer flavoprotein [Deltaproteobacteria bacterium CG11_big_fil_rev_8_21_14_0_20_42_23]PJA20240.1 MAG: electron transfer flavoprotein [Deltaproteobacteria bacterium CG_4_10_14_0_2_um_filter_43_8]PJC64868.1 MAG: electron transfer flavoprotein [Deltaproteobacteria bacterium CG_4_9_14_0_2_um_filter_42_21]